MLDIREVIVVEGKYDKKRLAKICRTLIIETDGFRIFKDRDKLDFLRRLAKERGLIIMTDPDRAGFVIRNYLGGAIDKKYIKHAYVPDIFGKEKRKEKPSAEGKLGVEGIDEKTLEESLLRAGCVIGGEENPRPITKLDLYNLGYIGMPESRARRSDLCALLSLPARLSTNALCDALNACITYEELCSL